MDTDDRNLNTLEQINTEFLLYRSEDGTIRIETRMMEETVWLTQDQMALLFNKAKSTINEHIKNIFREGELAEKDVMRKFGISEFSTKPTNYYNLDVIISVGYRVKSNRGTQFRIWATQRLREYIIKGFVIDDERLKNPPSKDSGVPDYFDEILQRIRDIRASERRMYLRVKEIFAMAADYEPSWNETSRFFSIIQNKLHFAATGMTAAELIQTRANYLLPNMGLTTWKGNEVHKTDVTIAKNYLNENEIDELNRIVVMWLDFAEDQARRRKQVFMKDWERKLDDFLRFNERNVLLNSGRVGKKTADNHAKVEYDKFEQRRRNYKESVAESEYFRQLENAAKELPPKKREDA